MPGLYELQFLSHGLPQSKQAFAVLPVKSESLDKKNFWNLPGGGRFVLTFKDFQMHEGQAQIPPELGFHGVQIVVPWKIYSTNLKDCIDWSALDESIVRARRTGIRVMIDFWTAEYPPVFTFHENPSIGQYHRPSTTAPENTERWCKTFADYCPTI